MYSLLHIGTGGEGPGLKPDDLCAIYRGLKPAATPKKHDLATAYTQPYFRRTTLGDYSPSAASIQNESVPRAQTNACQRIELFRHAPQAASSNAPRDNTV